MTMRIGRAVLNSNPKVGISLSGSTLSVPFEIVGTDANEMKAIRQQVAGLLGNTDEPVVPFIWSEDSSFDGFYTVSSVSIGSNANFLNTGFVADCQITLEQVPGFANPAFEVITQSVVRTNSHAITVPPSVCAILVGASPDSEIDVRGGLATNTAISRPCSEGGTFTVYTVAAPVAVTQSRAFYAAQYFYNGAARIEIKYGSTWYPIVGRNIPLSAVWRISNGLVRLTSAQGATSGTIEVWDGAQWDSQNVTHWTNGASTPFIGLGNASTQATVSIIRNTPEQVTVRCGGISQDFTYSLQRGNMHVVINWTVGTATKFGAGFTSATATTTITGGIRKTTNDAGGNRVVFSMPVLQTVDNVNGGTNAATATTSGTMMIGVELAGSAAISGNTAADIINQFMGATSWAQRVVPR